MTQPTVQEAHQSLAQLEKDDYVPSPDGRRIGDEGGKSERKSMRFWVSQLTLHSPFHDIC
jgi:hypothetical protein